MFGFRSVAVALTALLTAFSTAKAESKYPTKPIKVVVPQAAGNGADIVARVLSEHVGKQLNATIVVENRPGAEAVLGTTLAAKAPADGYTLLVGSTSAMAAAPTLHAKLNYDPIESFEHVTQLTQDSYVLVVKPDSPINSVADLIRLAKEQPGKVTFGSSNTTTRVASELFRSMAGLNLTHVPYTGTEQAIQDLINGQITMYFAGTVASAPYIKRGALKPLAVSSASRSANLPDVPALSEFVPGYSFSAWRSLVAPKGTPREVITTLNAAFGKAVQDPAIIAKLSGGTELKASTPEELAELIKNDITKWRTIVKEANIPVAN
jgi:tripartite-type tricarboxylate transporter receptor subunit TctC